jgi:TPR repeat protein
VEAVRLYKLAADQGYASAQFNLGQWLSVAFTSHNTLIPCLHVGEILVLFAGVCYEQGTVVAKDCVEATRLYALAAEQGDPDAQYNLGEGRSQAAELLRNVRYV